ncbi:FAD-binding protein [Cohnella zeiphila]|uniref:FAD-binding protein n=1 Tax=Cohnella zeiphila TaxID=2761120 RepID=A0A7X0SRC9_9BACL|nr:FAD-binding protein [Cohnella zeiphila]MBB6733694.1 FAD-binding protein [Cohnella zeiphila]
MDQHRNWAGNYTYGAKEIHVPETVEQAQEIVAASVRIKALGTRHSFNEIADSAQSQISLRKLDRIVALDRENGKVTVEGGVRYGELCAYLHEHGYALHNLASLPHISVAGACATATHGSGDGNGNLATAVHSMEVIQADGQIVRYSRDKGDGDIAAAAVGLGALGVAARLTLNVSPAFEVSQIVYENLPLSQLKIGLDDIFSSAYSVSLFTDWRRSAINQVWLKRRVSDGEATPAAPEFFGAAAATRRMHPISDMPAENCNEQLGIPGPWHERLSHFRLDFTPSAGEELQSEYFVARQDAYDTLCAIDRLRERIAPLLFVSEIRSIAADDLWMSPCYGQPSVAIHFTWKPEWEAVRQLLPLIEKELAPFRARPHWAKLFTLPPEQLQPLYEKLPDFRQLVLSRDPEGKFRNDFLNRYIL